MKPTRFLRPILALALATAPAAAQARVFPPLPDTTGDAKTAAEPNRPPDVVAARPAIGATPTQAPEADRALETHAVDPRSPVARTGGLDRTRVYVDTPGDGSIWARGAHFKAGFDAAGATYYPLFTSTQPQHYPILLSPDRVTVAGEPLAFDGSAAAQHASERVTIDRASFVETYDLTATSIEQTFSFDVLPRDGELVVHIPLAAGMTPRPCADGLELKNEFGRVTYGHATVIDALGRRFAATTDVEEDGIAIRVDAAFLRTAALPLVIDPVISTFPIDNTGYDDNLGDTSYDMTNQRWLAVYNERVTLTDSDVYWVMCNSSGVGMWGGYAEATTVMSRNVRSANLRSAQQFMAAFTYEEETANTRILGRQISASIYSISAGIFISGSESGGKGTVVVGGDPYPSGPAYYCVAYDRFYSPGDNDIFVRLVAPNGVAINSPIALSNSGGTMDDSPSISKSNGGSVWTLAWTRWHSSSSCDLWGARITYGGTVVNGPYQLTSGGYDLAPSVSSPLDGTNRTLIAYQHDYGTDFDIHALVQDGVTAVTTVDLSTMSGGPWYSKDQIMPSVDSDGRHFVVAYAERPNPGDSWNYDIYVDDLYMSGNTFGFAQSHLPVTTSGYREIYPHIASAGGSAGPTGRFFLSWTNEYNSSSHDVYGALFDTIPGGNWSTVCAGDGSGSACPCGNTGFPAHGCANSADVQGARLTITGSTSTLDNTATLSVTHTTPSTTCFFFQSTSTSGGVMFGDGLRCTSGSVVRLGTKATSGGATSLPQAGELPLSAAGGIPTEGATRYYQVLYRNNITFCTSATFNFSNGVRVVWAR